MVEDTLLNEQNIPDKISILKIDVNFMMVQKLF